MTAPSGRERERIVEAETGAKPWRRWGTYLSERQWGTVREDYSADGDAWRYFSHDDARSRTYRWGEDGLLGISDDAGHLCFALALWNEQDPFLKERLFGLSNPDGNHGEDVKEYYFYLDATPTHSYAKALYKYPQRAFPYDDLLRESWRRSTADPEYELVDTGIFDEDRYFDVVVEYAKAAPDDIVIRITATNRGPDAAPLHVLPTLWFRNTWSWGRDDRKPEVRTADTASPAIHAVHFDEGEYWLHCDGAPELLFTDNETNRYRLWGEANPPHVKDGINDCIVEGRREAVNAAAAGTKAAAHYVRSIASGASETILLRLSGTRHERPFEGADAVFEARVREADEFYAAFEREGMPDDERMVQRQAFAGLLWSKQFYHYDVEQWLEGDAGSKPPESRQGGRNADWPYLNNHDVISMPDTWEYPWYASWDLAFHCIPLASIDPAFAKEQLILLTREWFMHPNGQLPAYEWNLGDVNPPVHAWAALRVYEIERSTYGRGDRQFLERIFHKLLLNFTWWVNRKDTEGKNVFAGGFLGLDNIGVFDRSAPLPEGGHLEQADGTAWMGMFCINMLSIALELASHNRVYEDVATKFFEHFLYIAGALNDVGGEGLWDEEDEFFYDALHHSDGSRRPLQVRSLVGLIPLLAVTVIHAHTLDQLPDFAARAQWFIANRPHLASLISRWHEEGAGHRRMLGLVRGHRMKRLLSRMLDPEEFLSDYGVRSLSRYHLEHPFMLEVEGMQHAVRYEPGESAGRLFGGNSNWRGPIWFPINYLLIESLVKYHAYYGDDFRVEHPTGSGTMLTLVEVADELSRRLQRLFLRDTSGRRPISGGVARFDEDAAWRDLMPFHEYFHGDSGKGLGASHQTGWTALVATLLAGRAQVDESA